MQYTRVAYIIKYKGRKKNAFSKKARKNVKQF
nr:MAG TPA: hypothetical protein [Microviridae sp.]